MPLPELADLDAALQGRDSQPIFRRHLGLVARLIRAMAVRGDQRLDTLDEENIITNQRIDQTQNALTSTGQALDARLDTLEALNPVQIQIVSTVGQLPASAGARQWFRVVGDPNVYVGNGAGNPLTKIQTQALP